ncbi:MAG: DUF814 domain-containing protein [Trueperaceae bacterium]|nr:DUF814 domain-containing protein [Trueperaceae bacterium]MCO5174083.1 NFACT RNA binding domain-containing protein [Trueperaceae bacterium]MCW5820093.1 DUF814 domain-containing protein [Trueperaceae bacterium]
MEGLLIAEQLRLLEPLLPAARLAWSFPDDRTAVLPLAGGTSLWLCSRPPRPYVALRSGAPDPSRARTPFQQQLAARAVGPLVAASQPGKDRVLRLTFGPSEGFVPVRGVEVIVELTGRNANVVLVDDGLVIGVERQVLAERNRYRELRVGLSYRPPPPYSKLDPVGATAADVERSLAGRRIGEAGSVIDGVGPELLAALRSAAANRGVETAPLAGETLRSAAALVLELAADPGAFLERWVGAGDPMLTATAERQARARERLQRLLEKELELARRKLGDARAAVAAGEAAAELRAEGDLLLARAAAVPVGAKTVRLAGYDGNDVELTLDPRLDAAANARLRYDKARRRTARAKRAAEQLGALEAGVAAAEADLEALPRLAPAAVTARLRAAERGASVAAKAAGPGIRFRGPHGFEVVVGRNARDNDEVTFALAKSRDLWLHAQGYRGSHVLVRSGGKEIPFDTVLFAARLAAGYSEAKREDRVAVDYTERKNVWRQKGGPPGAVNFSRHRTVVVAPARDDAAASATERGRP